MRAHYEMAPAEQSSRPRGDQSGRSVRTPRSTREIEERFLQLYARSPRIIRAPGRVNLIGEHTDYNDGYVLPIAIGAYTTVAIAPTSARQLRVWSEHAGAGVTLDLHHRSAGETGHWSNYVLGVAALLEESGLPVTGADVAIFSDLPVGAGLSSSAALEIATARALLALADRTMDVRELALLCQRAEHEFAGAMCGIMDQFVVGVGRTEQALLLDCRSLAYDTLALPPDVQIVICNTMVKRELAAGEYNVRRKQCEEGVRHFAAARPAIKALRDVSREEVDHAQSHLPDVILRRCRHVVSENRRVLDSVSAIRRGDMSGFGKLMQESHRSLRDDYEVSCRELDRMVEAALECDGVYGARMTGGGFGGCTVNLVARQEVDEFRERVVASYRKATGIEPLLYDFPMTSDGADTESSTSR